MPPADPTANPWTTLSTTVRYEDRWIQLLENQVIDPAGQRTMYRTVHYKQRAAAVLPIDERGQAILVGQYRYTLDRYSWECPGGGGAPEHPIEDSARRELEEETGYRAGKLMPLLNLDMSNGIGDEQATCVLAWDLTPGTPNPDPSEVLTIKRLPFAEAVRMAISGGIREAVSVALILRVHHLIETGEAPPDLIAAVRPRNPTRQRTGRAAAGRPTKKSGRHKPISKARNYKTG